MGPTGVRGGLQRLVLGAAQRLHPSPHLTYVPLDYPPSAENRPRWGHGNPPHPQLAKLIGEREVDYRAELEGFRRYTTDLAAIRVRESGPGEPFWANGWLPGLDAVSLYSFIRSREPSRYVEVGSGNSTLFAARAKRDGRLSTEITSIDPHPQAAVDELCDTVVRLPLEKADLKLFDALTHGDMVFFDGSHRTFMNSDVTVFLLEVLPALPSGILVGVHDIALPDDYAPEFGDRYYSEQYLLAALLLGGQLVETVLPCAFVSSKPDLLGVLAELWENPMLAGIEPHGAAFWMTVT